MNPEIHTRNEKIDKFVHNFGTFCLDQDVDSNEMISSIYYILTLSYLDSNLTKLQFLKNCGDSFDHYQKVYEYYNAQN